MADMTFCYEPCAYKSPSGICTRTAGCIKDQSITYFQCCCGKLLKAENNYARCWFCGREWGQKKDDGR